jgi:hypothetical protein
MAWLLLVFVFFIKYHRSMAFGTSFFSVVLGHVWIDLFLSLCKIAYANK